MRDLTQTFVKVDKKAPARLQGPVPQEQLQIGDLAKITGKTARALRHYEELGLLDPDHRTAGGFRIYGQDAVARLHWIAKLQTVGFTLNRIQDLAQVARKGDLPRVALDAVRETFLRQLESLQAKIQRLRQLEADLCAALGYLDGCQRCQTHIAKMDDCRTCASHGGVSPPDLVRGISGFSKNEKATQPIQRRGDL